ncbi:MAG: glycoside hydrolase family 16 protein, partial [Verrucomicrobia bacterium]|nr:glycoside hydrolase family 16 protein [Verrucomicrobiota bacterium]
MRSAVAFTLGLFLTAFNAKSQTQLRAAPQIFPATPATNKWVLTFSDEFNGTALDLKKWNPKDPWGRERNAELQAYVTNAFAVHDGTLAIKCDRGRAEYAGKMRHFTSGMMTTYQKFSQKFGRWEIRCRVPKGKGFWPAFWLLPEPLGWPPEIDVLEILGREPNRIHMTHHWHNPEKRLRSDTKDWVGPDFSADFHTFAIEWEADHIAWFVDGVERHRSMKSIPQVPMYMLVNLALGGDWAHAPDDTT